MNRKGSDGLSRKNTAHTPTATRDQNEPAGGSRASETGPRLIHFERYRPFTLDELLSADAVVLGKNFNWTMYKATLGDGTQLAVRILRAEETAEDFVTQVNLLGKIRHPNLLPPRAYFYYRPNPNGDKFLVFDYMPKGSLSDFLHARQNSMPMDWPTRMNIVIGVARGLHHLHTQGNMVHGNLSNENVLLDYHVNAKVGGYGVSKLLTPPAAAFHFGYTTMSSWYRYRAPELSSLNNVNTKTDVYSFGVIMLELLTGKSPRLNLDTTEWVASITEVETTAQPLFRDTHKLALKCVDASPDVRPDIQEVLQQLEEIKSKYEKTTHSPTTNGGNKPNDAGAAAASNITTSSPETGERRASPFKDDAIQTPWTSNNFAHDGNLLQPCASENLISSPLASSSEAMPDSINSSKHKDENLSEMTPGTWVSTLSSIDWATVDIQVRLDVPTSPPPISSEPDLIYQSYFLTSHKLANTSPPLPSDALEGQLNRMLVGLHSMGYPLDVWTKAATLLLVSAKKREHIERYVDDYKVRLDVQVGEFTSAVNLVKEDLSRIQSDLSALEQRNQELDETIAGLKLEQEKVVGELTVARDQLATAEAKAESMSMDMDRAKQQRSATSQLRDEMLQQLPSMDQVFDSAFQEIMAKKF